MGVNDSRLFRIEGAFADDRINYRSGVGAPSDDKALLMAMPKGSFYTDILTGYTWKKVGDTGFAVDFKRQLDTADYTDLQSQITAGGGDTAALQGEVNVIESAVGLNTDGTLGTVLSGTNYISASSSVVNAVRTLDTQVKTNADAIAAEVTRATGVEAGLQSAIDAEITNRVAAVDAAAAAAAGQLATETAARIAGDDALVDSIGDVQAELDTVELAAGLNTDGTYTAPADTTYLGAATSLKTADVALDTAIAAEVARATGVEAALSSALANEAQLRADADTNLQTQITEWVNVQLTNNATADLAEQAARIAGDSALQSELDATQAAIGLDTDGNIIPITGTNYLDGVTTVFGGAFVLDTQIKVVADALAAEVTARTGEDASLQSSLTTETAARSAADAAIQSELNTTQAGAGLETDGTYASPVGSNYLDGATSLKGADYALDAAVKVVADAVAAETAARVADVDAEETRALAAEAALTTAVNNEQARAEAAEAVLTAAVAAEQSRAEAAEAAIEASVTLLDAKQTETAALLLSARKESAATNISAATMVDEVATQQVEAAKWTVMVKGVGADARRRVVMEVLALHNGTDAVDADAIDYTVYAKLRLNEITDVAVTVELTGTGAAQRMQLKVASPTISVDVYAVRERLPGIDLGAGNGGGAGGGNDDDNWTPGDKNFLFGSESYTPNANIVF